MNACSPNSTSICVLVALLGGGGNHHPPPCGHLSCGLQSQDFLTLPHGNQVSSRGRPASLFTFLLSLSLCSPGRWETRALSCPVLYGDLNGQQHDGALVQPPQTEGSRACTARVPLKCFLIPSSRPWVWGNVDMRVFGMDKNRCSLPLLLGNGTRSGQ